MFAHLAFGVQLLGLAVVIFGGLRIVRAPALAQRRSAVAAPEATPDAARRYARGLTDFYRISGAIAVLAGVVLLLVPRFAG